MRYRPLSGKPKTPKAHAFGVFVCALVWAGFAVAACPIKDADESVKLAQVVDGDTLRLQDGRRVRVLGINTPEIARDGRPGQDLGNEASAASRRFLSGGQVIHLVYDQERRDRYGRLLAHVYNQQRESLAAHLLERGLALQVVVPPNASELNCLAGQEKKARAKNRGVWQKKQWQLQPAAEFEVDESGFRRVSGKITKVSVQRDIWLELDGPVVIRIAHQDRQYFAGQQWQAWLGQTVEVRGWVINRASEFQRKRGFKPLQLQVRHPLMFESSPLNRRVEAL